MLHIGELAPGEGGFTSEYLQTPSFSGILGQREDKQGALVRPDSTRVLGVLARGIVAGVRRDEEQESMRNTQKGLPHLFR